MALLALIMGNAMINAVDMRDETAFQGGRRERLTLDFKCNVSSSPIISFSIIFRTAFTDVSFAWPYIAQVNCSRLLITSGFTDQSSPNCQQKCRESRMQYVYTKSSHTKTKLTGMQRGTLECFAVSSAVRCYPFP